MKITFTKFLLFVLPTFCSGLTNAQTTSIIKKNNLYLNTFVGYGTENNFGNTGFFTGVTLSKPIIKHLFFDAGLTVFTTQIVNAYTYEHGFRNDQQKYNALFLTPAINYTFGNKQSFINASIKVGASLKYYNYKILKTYMEYLYPDGRREPMPSTFLFYEKNGFNISLYNSVSFDVKVTPKLRVGVFLDVYSYEIPIEHFMPGINAVFKL